MNATNTVKRIGQQLGYLIGAAALVAAFSGTALAATGISATKHNLSNGGPGNKFSGTDQICVFCHTPHGSDADVTHPPLWNRTMPTSASFTTYDSLGTSTLNGKVLAVGSVSLACLSCHDGTQAMNTVINAPGSGTSNSGWTAGTWTAGASGMGGGLDTGALTGIVAIGADLKNDHPVGIQYCGGGVRGDGAGGWTTSTCSNDEFIGTTSGSTSDGRTGQVKTAMINGQPAYWVNVDGDATGRGKNDIRLYGRNFTSVGGGTNTPSVECGSCHDPHAETAGTNNVAFMRVEATSSKICLSCHVK